MKTAKILRIYLHQGALEPARAGKMRFIRLMQEVMQDHGYRVEYRAEKETELLKSAARNGYSLFHMKDPFHDRALTFRKVYLYPFWQIEKSGKRWEWEVAKTAFDPNEIDAGKAAQLASYWRKQLFPQSESVQYKNFVFIPLQGRLLQHRSFQSMSPMEMIKSTLTQMPDHNVIATLHPSETYTSDERAGLEEIISSTPRFQLSQHGSTALLQNCEMVVSQNSGVAFHGYFLNKPTVLFGQSDFHHIAGNVWRDGVEQAFHFAKSTSLDFEKYLFWKLNIMSINAGKADVKTQIKDSFIKLGWNL